jgi:hypothetical protein
MGDSKSWKRVVDHQTIIEQHPTIVGVSDKWHKRRSKWNPLNELRDTSQV